MPRVLSAILLSLPILSSTSSLAQNTMPGMDMGTSSQQQSRASSNEKAAEPAKNMQMSMDMRKPSTNLIESELTHTASGTSAEPPSTPMSMIMFSRGNWMLMLHGNGFIADTQQHAASDPAGPSAETCAQFNLTCNTPADHRGGDKLYSPNWIMPMAMRQLGPDGRYGQLTLRAMFSLEPATISGRQFPELFQQGETAFGKPIVDGQHPHDFFMEVAALYDLRIGTHALLSFYAAPIGDPAIGPTAYPHRLSASEDPLAALGHHQQDSTHIAFNVLTAGFTYRWLRFEESGFHGAEPTEQRWGFQPSPNGLAIDTYSSRITFTPTPNWTSQYSIAHIASPEALYPGEDQQRQTASVMYNRPFGPTGSDGAPSGNWSSTLLWGRTKSLTDSGKENSYLLESLAKFHTRNYIWTRIENAGRSNELLLTPGSPLPANFTELPLGHVAAYSLGYDRDYPVVHHLLVAPGAQFTSYTTPGPLVSTYGAHPFGVVVFLHLRIGR